MKRAISTIAMICALGMMPGAVMGQAKSSGVLLVATSHDAPLIRDGEGYIAIYDAATGDKQGQIPNGKVMAHELVVLKDQKTALAPIYGSGGVGTKGTDGDSIAVIDLTTRKTTGYIELGRKNRPHFGVQSEKDGLVYITTELDNTITVVDPKARKVVAILPTGQPQSHNVAVSRDGKRAYTSNVYVGTVSVIDIPVRKLVTVVPIAPGGRDPSGGRANWAVQRMVMTNDDKLVMTCDWETSELVGIDTKSLAIAHRIKLPSNCYGMAATPDSKYVLTSDYNTDSMSVVDLKTMKVARSIKVPKNPQEIIISPDGAWAFVTCAGTDEIARVDLKTWTVDKIIKGGRWPDGIAWAAAD